MACEVALEAAHRLHTALALGFLSLQVSAGLGVDPATGDRDDVKRPVELAVAAAVEAVTLVAAGGDGDRRDAGGPCAMRVAGETLRAGGLPDQDRRAERAAAGLGKQLGATVLAVSINERTPKRRANFGRAEAFLYQIWSTYQHIACSF